MKNPRGLPLASIPDLLCRNLEFFFFDIDDTCTWEGRLPAGSYAALWQLYESGVKNVPVTGRPAGWCDHIARMWPVEAIIGENGAFYFYYDRRRRRMNRRYLVSEQQRMEAAERLQRIRDEVLRQVPGSRVAADQEFRSTDLAIDYCEDAGPLGGQEVNRICEIMAEAGARFKVSSIHVNCWYGDFDKVACLKLFLQEHGSEGIPPVPEKVIFIGDSPNDEPMFRELDHTIAVANIKRFLADLSYPPRYIADKDGAQGFCQAVAVILEKRRQAEEPGGRRR